MRIITRALLITALLAPLAASAQNTPTDTSKTGGTTKTSPTDTSHKEKLADADLQIMAHYRNDNTREIDLGKAAMKRGASKGVKEYGEMLVKDHGDFDKQLTALAKKTGQLIPKEKLDDAKKQEQAAAQKHTAELMKLTGAAFEREYLRMMIEDHDKALAAIDGHIAAAKSAELADVLRQVKPILQRHADRARELQKDLPAG